LIVLLHPRVRFLDTDFPFKLCPNSPRSSCAYFHKGVFPHFLNDVLQPPRMSFSFPYFLVPRLTTHMSQVCFITDGFSHTPPPTPQERFLFPPFAPPTELTPPPPSTFQLTPALHCGFSQSLLNCFLELALFLPPLLGSKTFSALLSPYLSFY